jgi:hypothetical protein
MTCREVISRRMDWSATSRACRSSQGVRCVANVSSTRSIRICDLSCDPGIDNYWRYNDLYRAVVA